MTIEYCDIMELHITDAVVVHHDRSSGTIYCL